MSGAPSRELGLRARYRTLVPRVVRRPLWWARNAPHLAVLRSNRLSRSRRGRALQATVLRRRSLARSVHGEEAAGHLGALAAAALDQVDQLEARVGRHRPALGPSLFSFVAAHLEARHDHYENRCSPAHLRSMAERFAPEVRAGDVVLEVGSGSQNPFALPVLLVLLGADEAIGIDTDPVVDELVAARSVALTVSWMLTAPTMLLGDRPAPTATIAERASELDCERLWRGDLGALDGSRVRLLARSATDTGLDTDTVDLTLSNSVLEHLSQPAEAMAELARVTRSGGRAVHAIDASDHHRYVYDGLHPLTFLEVESTEALMNGSNRLRPHQLAEACAAAGFVVDELEPTDRIELTEADRASFVEPYRSMSLQQLEVTHAVLRAHLPS
jgi:SAM-dependent methyltransferase